MDILRYNKFFNCDPVRNVVKTLHVDYIDNNNNINSVEFSENTEIKIPELKQIKYAKYGANNIYVDVTDNLCKLMNINEIYVPKTKYNRLFGCDPAHMKRKTLHIRYLDINDKIEDIFFDENSEIKIKNIKKTIFAKYGIDDKQNDVTQQLLSKIYNLKKTQIYKSRAPRYLNDYYEYILSILKYISDKNNLPINIILGFDNHDFKNSNKTIKICINYEHTLVKEGGRSVPKGTPFGKIKYNENKNYLVRIDKFKHLNPSDIIIDYSNPNIANVKESGLFSDFSNKHIYVAPFLYKNLYINTNNRKIQSLTTFINIKNNPRRIKLLENISKTSLIHSNISDCFNKTSLQKLFQNTKVLINIHQTLHHDTFEELRCLPALQNGVIVVSEKSPLSHLIPYNELIIWTDYDNIINKTKEVLESYEEYHKNIFSKKNIEILNNIDNENKRIIEDKIMNINLE